MILGTAQLCGAYGALGQSVEGCGDDPVSFLRLATQLGVGAFDTAPVYPGAEDALGTAGLATPIHTKLDPASSPLSSIQSSLRRLRRENVDLVYFHDPSAALVDSGVAIRSAASVRDCGYVKALGASVYSVEALTASADSALVDVIQIPLNPMLRAVGDASVRLGHSKRVIGRSVLAQGLLATDPSELPSHLRHLESRIAAFQRLAREFDRSPAELALLWARDHPALDDVIVGAVSVAQLREIIRILGSQSLSVDERAAIDALGVGSENDFDPRRWD